MKHWTAAFFISFLAHTAFAQVPRVKMIVSYNGLTSKGRNNRDSVLQAFENLGVPIDSVIDRDAHGSDTIDYSPYAILVWACGDPTIGTVPDDTSGQAAPSTMEIAEIEKFLIVGEPDCKRSLIIAGENLAFQLGSVMPHGPLDTAFLQSWLHVHFVADSPTSGPLQGWIVGEQPAYWKYNDSISSVSPDVIRPAMHTAPVGPVVNQLTYSYSSHPLTPSDSGAGVSFYNPSLNIVFYSFDWADPIVTKPTGHADTTSGVTRVMAGALAFIESHGSYFCTESVEGARSQSFILQSIVPNASGQAITITISLPKQSRVSIRIRNMLGQIVKTETVLNRLGPGTSSIIIDLSGTPRGAYLCELSAENIGTSNTVAKEFILQ